LAVDPTTARRLRRRGRIDELLQSIGPKHNLVEIDN
jgi:hypothetical protein